MSSVGQFPVQYTDIDECPVHFRAPLNRVINATENIYYIIYSPAFLSGGSLVPGSVFCVTDRGWLIVHEPKRKGDGIVLASAIYADTLLVELTNILLYGQLKIHYAFNDQSASSACNFNTVFEDMYTNAIQRVLNLIDDVTGPVVEKDRRILR